MSRTSGLIIALLFFCSMVIVGQEEATADAETLFDQTIAQDIATASFYELVSWLESLGESTQGNRSVLVARLAGVYAVTEEQLAAAQRLEPDAGDTLVIDNASRTRYFSLSEIEEQYVQLSGDVVITLTDSEQGARHTIQAQEIVLNREQNTLSASGSVTYLLEREGSVERFSGEALSVRLDDFSGAFVRGVTERERTIEGREIDFDFSGRYITRSPDEVIVLEDGVVTSSQSNPPNYYIAANRIWVFSPGEWGLSNAVLHVGRVPVFYFPFFFRPGDDLFFNPAIGSRRRDGLFMQTTTYLLGTPPAGDTPLSILQLAEEPVDQSQRVRDGLFLVIPEGPQLVEQEQNEDQFRVLLDIYTMLGAFVGIDGKIAEAGGFRNLEFFNGLGVTRHVYQYSGQGVAFSPYYISAAGADQSWNTTTIGPLELPVRLGTTFSGSFESSGLVASLQFEAFSDSRFPVDFLDRAEQIDWFGLLGQSEPVSAPSAQTSLLWQAEMRYTPDVELPAILRTLSLQRLSGSLRWSSRQIATSSLADHVLEADNSPQVMFFYPDSMRLPEISASIAGTLLDLPGRREQTPGEDFDFPDLIPPWHAETALEGTEETAAVNDQSASVLRVPPVQPNLPEPPAASPGSTRVTYSVSPTVLLDHEFNDAQWMLPQDIDFSLAYRGLSSRLSSSVSYNSQIAASLVAVNGSFSANGQYRSVFDRDATVPDTTWDALELQAWTFSSFSTTNTNTLLVRPLQFTTLLRDSTLSHTIQTLLYRSTFDQVVGGSPTYTSEPLQIDDPDFVRAHRIDATAVFDVLDTQRLQLSADLPPRDPRYSASVDLRAQPFTLRVASATSFSNDVWRTDPVTASLSMDLLPLVLVSTDLSYDVENSIFDFARASVRGAGVSLLFEARQAQGYTFSGAGVGWQPSGSERLRPVRFDAGYSLASDIGPLWKNRFLSDIQTRIAVSADLLRFTQSSLNFTFSGSMLVHEFLGLDLSITSSNDQIYVYIPGLAQEVGRTPKNVFIDLLRSINFFSDNDRRQSAFNLQRLQLSAIHDLGDWDLTVALAVSPELVTDTTGPSTYELASQFSLTVQWRPIGELASTISANRDGIGIGDNP